jgi:hypothetical protein
MPYVVLCKANIEADGDLKNTSANMVKDKGINTLTLKERLLVGRFHWWRDGIILDKDYITLCSGSRCFSVGDVPRLYWNGVRLFVYFNSPDASFDDLRPRRAVSF